MNAKIVLASILTILCLTATAAAYFNADEPAAGNPSAQRSSLSSEDWRRLAKTP